jgi:hypothetical protein
VLFVYLAAGRDSLHVVDVVDDPAISGRLRGFLAGQNTRYDVVSAEDIRAAAALQVDGRRRPAPAELVAAMLTFESRYGGLTYPLVVGNTMEYGLDGDVTAYPTLFGPAFTGILDGDWNCGVDILPDGRTALALGAWPRRIIDRSVDQRLEKHAMLALVRRWPHRAYECFTESGHPPVLRAELLPPLVPEATGPADLWWFDQVTAVQVTLRGWPPRHDHWLARVFTRDAQLLAGEDSIVRSAVHDGRARPAWWCELCTRGLPGAGHCQPRQ